MKLIDEKYIERLNREAISIAKEQKLPPCIIKNQEEIDNMPPFPFMYFGDYIPLGWGMIDIYLVDITGMGTEDEPALTIKQFKKKLKVGRGYAVIELGPYQVKMGEFVKTKKRVKK